MSDEPGEPVGKRPRSREQLLRLLHDNPGSVDRVEIKAAFADGRLGDQDLDIPVLAGMKRITELLAELDPNGGSDPPHGAAADALAGTSADPIDTVETSRATSTSLRIGDVEAQLEHVADRLTALETRLQEERVAAAARAAAEDQAGQATARTLRVIAVVLVIVVVVVALQVALRFANG